MLFICLIINCIDIWSSYKTGYPIFLKHINQPLRLWAWILYFYLGGYIKKFEQQISHKSFFSSLFYPVCLSFINVYFQTEIGPRIHFEWAEYFYDNPLILIWSLCILVFFLNDCFNNIKEKTSNFIVSINKLTTGCFILHIIFVVNIRTIYQYNLPYVNIFLAIIIFVFCILITFILQKIPIIRHMINI